MRTQNSVWEEILNRFISVKSQTIRVTQSENRLILSGIDFVLENRYIKEEHIETVR